MPSELFNLAFMIMHAGVIRLSKGDVSDLVALANEAKGFAHRRNIRSDRRNPVHPVWFSLRLCTHFPSKKLARSLRRLSRIITYAFVAFGTEIAAKINDFCQE